MTSPNACAWCCIPLPTTATYPDDPEDVPRPGQWHSDGVSELTCPACCPTIRPWISARSAREPDYGAPSAQELAERDWAAKRSWE